MRVVAGSLGGRRLEPPPGRRARPTSDRVREAMFNALDSRGVTGGARVLDLFAGTGALGIEALSRGAAHVTFVERDRQMLAVLDRNLAALGIAERATVRPMAVERALDRPRSSVHQHPGDPAAGETPTPRGDIPAGTYEFDLVLADPPYEFRGWPELLDGVPAAVAVLESDVPPEVPTGWRVVSERRYGGTLVTFVERTRPSSGTSPDEATGGEQ